MPYRVFTLLTLCCGLLGLSLNSHAETAFQPEAMWPPTIQSGRYFNFPDGIARDAQGLFYITDSGNHRVKVLNAQGELVRTWGSFGTGDGQFDNPAGIALTPGGEVLVADLNNSRIQKFSAEGQFLAQWGGQGTADGQLNYASDLAVDAQGQVYVSDTGNDRIQVFNAHGQWQRSFGGSGNAAGQLKDPKGIVVTAAGEVYVADGSNHRISVFDTQGQFLRTWGTQGTDPGQFDSPQNIALDARGNVYVTEYDNNRIQVFDRNGQWLRTWGKFGVTGADLWTPFGLLVDRAQNRVWVVDSSNNRIQHYDVQGNYLGAWQSQGSGPGEFNAPYVSVSPQGELTVAESNNHRVQILSSSGQWRSFGEQGSAPGQFSLPDHVAFTAQGQLFIADFDNNRIQVFDAQGRYVRHFGVSGSASGQLDRPARLFLAADGLLYITEAGNHRVSVFTPDGQFVRSWGQQGVGDGEFNQPDGIVVDADGLVYVADRLNHRLQVFDKQGKFLRQIGKFGSQDGEFNLPTGLALSPSGLLYVADAWNNRIQVFKRDGTWLESIGSVGTQAGQFGQPYSVAVPDDNTLYVGEAANNRVQKLTRRAVVRSPYKAVLLAGSGPSTGSYSNHIWKSTQVLSNNAYFALSAQGFNKDSLRYLTAGQPFDLDGNPGNDNQPATLASLQQAITEWAADADQVLIYMNGHGGEGSFRVTPTEILTRKTLKDWLATLDSKISGKITLILEACQSGSFFPELKKARYNLIASTGSAQPAIISNDGMTSFSYPFWYRVQSGDSLQQAFKQGLQYMSAQEVPVKVNGKQENQPQHAQLEANGDEQFNEQDYASLGDYCLGLCKKFLADEPIVTPLLANTALHGQTRFTLSMQVTSLAPISRAWALITRPDLEHSDPSQAISDIPTVILPCTDQGNGQYRCQGDYAQFDVNGDYRITLHAQDNKDRTSPPSATITLTQSGQQDPSSTAADNSLYDAATGQVIIQDVEAGGQHYQVTLQQMINGHFALSAAKETTQRFTPAAQFNADSGLLSLPKVRVQNHYYHVTLQHLGNFVFALGEVKDLGVAASL